jgi:site-specific DNA-adenine methylase
MFSYYGSKASLVKYYPRPTFDTICEPFAGSARYALEHYSKKVILYDANPEIISIWNYLIKVPEDEIRALPKLKTGQSIPDSLSKDERTLLKYLVNAGSAAGGQTVTEFVGDITPALESIASQLFKIRHWVAKKKSVFEIFSDEREEERTWFLDPPYQFGGEHYTYSSKQLSFPSLAKVCQSLKGQVMVCENTKAKWLDFKPVVNNNGLKYKTVEAMWCNFDWQPMSEQLTMF